MAGTDIKINITVNVSAETARTCCKLLSMFLSDHLDADLDLTGWKNTGGVVEREVKLIYVDDL